MGDERGEILRVAVPLGEEEIAILRLDDGAEGGRPRAIAWHGTTLTNRLSGWDVLLPETRPLVMAGLPGHGPVPRMAAGHYRSYSPAHFVDTGEAVVRRLAGDGRVLLAGGSLGGSVALGVASRVPELVSGLLLLSPLVWPDTGGLVELWARAGAHLRLCSALIHASLGPARVSARMLRLSALAFVSDSRAYLGNPAVGQAIADGHAEFRSSPIPGLAATMCVLRDFDLRSELSTDPPAMPTLILHGTADKIVPYRQAVWLASALPNATLRPLPRLGHLPHAEGQELVTREIRDWLRSTQSRAKP